jgi:hypothetical protein
VSTLNPAYYHTFYGKRLLSLIEKSEPEIYIELHSYHPINYKKLTDFNSRQKAGVPPFIEIQDGILLGSVSPFIWNKVFRKNEFCLSIEIPSNIVNLEIVINLLMKLIRAQDRRDSLKILRDNYPLKTKKAEEFFYNFYLNSC